jgi:hypothetical protein
MAQAYGYTERLQPRAVVEHDDMNPLAPAIHQVEPNSFPRQR